MIGRGFSYALLRAVTGMEDAPLQTDGTARGSRHVVGPGRAAGIRLSLQIFHGREGKQGLCQTRLRSQCRQWVGLSGMGRLALTSRQPEPSRRQGNINA